MGGPGRARDGAGAHGSRARTQTCTHACCAIAAQTPTPVCTGALRSQRHRCESPDPGDRRARAPGRARPPRRCGAIPGGVGRGSLEVSLPRPPESDSTALRTIGARRPVCTAARRPTCILCVQSSHRTIIFARFRGLHGARRPEKGRACASEAGRGASPVGMRGRGGGGASASWRAQGREEERESGRRKRPHERTETHGARETGEREKGEEKEMEQGEQGNASKRRGVNVETSIHRLLLAEEGKRGAAPTPACRRGKTGQNSNPLTCSGGWVPLRDSGLRVVVVVASVGRRVHLPRRGLGRRGGRRRWCRRLVQQRRRRRRGNRRVRSSTLRRLLRQRRTPSLRRQHRRGSVRGLLLLLE